ncbi:transporter substrate-binding domain-containing protein [Aquimarina brevivitae]|uniref:Membrane-bound lytic murein transglycosylase F n=1 Tax=Aquimarina brevivitae TaxID=323412 RepID=A0A4Q7P2F5_9FLAO|nr:transporter substrate-binding domain-containing protein [Aquimarina brevivitae]RZS93944.1 membrane-bound lytic murein transglycosylase F [Aquimarina brevivitae]
MKHYYLIILTLITLLCSCNTDKEQANKIIPKEPVSRDLAAIQKSGKLKVLITYSSTSYFLYRGQPMGFEYELLERLAAHLDLELELVLVKNMDSIFHNLNEGEADMIAHGLTITKDRKKEVSFTEYLYLTQQVLVQKKPDNWRSLRWNTLEDSLYHNAIDLIGDTVAVRENSSYIKRIENLSRELGGPIYIDTLSGTLSTEEIIKKVADGELKYTVADKNLANVNATYNPILNVNVPLSLSQRIAWAVRKNSPQLLEAINQWIAQEKKEAPYHVIYNRYFKNKRDYRRRIQSEFMSINGNKISEYDGIIKKYADTIGWDWRLITSLIYQESRFKNDSQSWTGAQGLMQLMPSTALSLGVNNLNDPAQNIKGGITYLQQNYEKFTEVKDSLQRIKFTMAAYNCGYYHIKDAQFLAQQENLNPHIWDDHVEKMVLALTYPSNYNKPGVKYGYVRGIEPVNYVKQIMERYEHYKKFIAQE